MALTAIVLAVVPSPSAAHEGHAEHDGPPATMAPTFPRVITRSEQYELVGVLKGDILSIYVDRVPTNEPATNLIVEVTIADGNATLAENSEGGIFTLRAPRLATLTEPVEIVFNITSPNGDDLLLGTIAPIQNAAAAPVPSWALNLPAPLQNSVVLAGLLFVLGLAAGRLVLQKRRAPAVAVIILAAGLLSVVIAGAVTTANNPSAGKAVPFTPPSDAPRRLADGTAFIAKPTQRLLEVRTTLAEPVSATPAITLTGRVTGDPDRTSVVQSVLGGRVTALEHGFPRIGQRVKKGEPLVQIEPHVPAADRTTISERLGEIDQLIAVAEARIKRLRPLAERGVTPQSQLIDAETELEGLRRRRETLRTVRIEREILTAPTDGVVALARAVQGQVVQAQDLLFEIVDPQALLVEALLYGSNVDPGTFGRASALTPTGESLTLEYRGFSRALRHHAAAVQFKIVDPPALLKVSQPVTVTASVGVAISGQILPRDAVVRSPNGESIVWLQINAERFEPRPVRTRPFDAGHVIVAAGVSPSDRIVVRSADLINQVR